MPGDSVAVISAPALGPEAVLPEIRPGAAAPVTRDGAPPAARWPRRWLNAWTLLALFLVFVGLLLARRLTVLTQPQFYAEDGADWFAAAHNLGLASLFLPGPGYLTLFNRVVGLALAPLGLVGAARAFAAVGLVVQALPAVMFASPRLRPVVRNDAARVAIGLLYVLVPNAELTGNLTNTQWHLAVLAFLVIIAARPASRLGRASDIAALLIAGLTGPFVLLIAPLAWLLHRRHPDRIRRTELTVLCAALVVQVVVLAVNHASARSGLPLDASPLNLVLAIATQMLVRITPHTVASVPVAAVITAVVGVTLWFGMRRGPRELRYFVVFAVAVAAGGLLFPARGQGPLPAWLLYGPVGGGGGERYFFFLYVALTLSVLAIVCGTSRRHTVLIGGLAVVVAAMVVSIAGEWQYVPLPDEHLARYQVVLDRAPRGTTIVVPVTPAEFDMRLTAQGPGRESGPRPASSR